MAKVPERRAELEFSRRAGPDIPANDLARQYHLRGPKAVGGPPGATAQPIPDFQPKTGGKRNLGAALNPGDLRAKPC